jgi:hypothetical protein
MPEVLIILEDSIATAEREAIIRNASPTQSISDRVYLAVPSEIAIDALRSTAGVATVLTGSEPVQCLPSLDEAESLFVQAWVSARGQVKQRRGEGVNWDTPPMLPPDPKR